MLNFLKSIKKGTVVRTILLVVVIINEILKRTGHSPIDVDASFITSTLETIVEIAIVILCWWKNNSITTRAQIADKYLEALRDFSKEEVQMLSEPDEDYDDFSDGE